MAKRTFKMNGSIYTSMMDIARELGVKRVYPKDFGKYGITEITDDADKADDVAENKAAEDVKKAADVSTENTKAENDTVVEDKKADDAADDSKEESQMVKKTTKATKKAVAKPATKKAVKKTGLEQFSAELRVMSLDDLVTLAQNEGVDDYGDTIANEKIRRMRITMALKNKKFPGQKLDTKKVSFKHVSLEALKEFAQEVGVTDYTVTSEERTQKMWIIHALNQAGYYDIPEKKDKAVNE
jgi:hypothetical protein